ncbi:MAG: hypothetical protein IKU36_01605 [Bacteroidales bacterium]|nr:hypothetical protein [Clostridiales bacterium]MBR5298925.1 hypothetical protein [Bacteroidales bacterium]
MNKRMKEYLCHMTDAEKKAYNAEYYRNHKNYWEDYYSKGRTVGRPVGRQKYVTEGNGQGIKRRGAGLGTGPVGRSERSKKRETTWTETIIPETIQTETILTEQTPEQLAAQQHANQHKPSKWDEYKENVSSNLNAIGDATKKAAKQAASDWKAGAKSISSMAKDSVESGKKAFSKLLSKFR